MSNARNRKQLINSKDNFFNSRKLLFGLELTDRNEPGIKFYIRNVLSVILKKFSLPASGVLQ